MLVDVSKTLSRRATISLSSVSSASSTLETFPYPTSSSTSSSFTINSVLFGTCDESLLHSATSVVLVGRKPTIVFPLCINFLLKAFVKFRNVTCTTWAAIPPTFSVVTVLSVNTCRNPMNDFNRSSSYQTLLASGAPITSFFRLVCSARKYLDCNGCELKWLPNCKVPITPSPAGGGFHIISEGLAEDTCSLSTETTSRRK